MARNGYTRTALRDLSPLARGLQTAQLGASFPSQEAFEREHLADYKPHDAQDRLMRAMGVSRFVCVVAGRRSGKTYAGGREFLRRIAIDYQRQKENGGAWTSPTRLTKESKPLLWYWCVAPTYGLGVYQRRELFEVLGGIDGPLVMKWDASNNSLWLRGGILIEFKTSDNPKRLVGSGLNGVWFDEAARAKSDAWDDNLRPALSDRMGWALITTTPLGKNWVYDDFWAQNDEDYASIHFRTVDNTALPHLVAEVESARRTLPKAVFLRNYEASFDAFVGKIFESFIDDATHVVKTIPLLTRRFAGIDWGHSNPGSQIEIGQSVDGSLIAYREDYVRELPLMAPPEAPTVDSWINRYKAAERRGTAHYWADPSEPANIVLCRQHKLDVRRADNSVNPGIDLLSMLLKPAKRQGRAGLHPLLYIHESAVNLRRELAGYRWGENGKPVKEYDHSVDALRYGLYTESKRNGLFVVEQLEKEFPNAFDMAA